MPQPTRPAPAPADEPVPADGALPVHARSHAGARGFGLYVHVPFCATRCGYCDFNTYTAAELGGGASRDRFADTVLAELHLARRVLDGADLPVRTVFFGGGTPTLLPAADFGTILAAAADLFGLARGAEVTAEANPESVDAAALDRLRAAGVNRLSIGMQSAVPHVLDVLDRRHTPGRAVATVARARAAGFDSVSLDLIYGTPGESPQDWQASLDAALAAGVDHVSAYALTVEPGTRLARRVRRGELAAPDDDELADRYEQAEAALSAAGYGWYEVSNWARPGHACRHNLGYWRRADWWGLGPGAHSAVGPVRWWNRRHPAGYARRLAAGLSPAQGREVLDAGQQRTETVLLGLRLATGLPAATLPPDVVRDLIEEGLARCAGPASDDVVLTLRGRLLADGVARRLLG